MMKAKEISAFIEHAKEVALSRKGLPLKNESEAKMYALMMHIISLEKSKEQLLDTVERYRSLCRRHGISLD